MYIQDLMIELTRSCNMVCTHCIRGKAQNTTISMDTISDFFDKLNVLDIGTLMFTGGEPSLYPELIMETVALLERKNIPYQSFFIATNGIHHNKSDEFFIALANLHKNSEDRYMNNVRVSRDSYHVLSPQTVDDELLSVFSFVEINDIEEYDLYNEGFAFDNGLQATKSYDLEDVRLDVSFDDQFDIEVSEPIYLASNGNIGIGCDFSYERFDRELSCCNIKEVVDEKDFVSKLLKHSFDNDVNIDLDENVVSNTSSDFREFYFSKDEWKQ